MKGLTDAIKETLSASSYNSRDQLLDYIERNRAEFEQTPDEPAIVKLIEGYEAWHQISDEVKSAINNSVKAFLNSINTPDLSKQPSKPTTSGNFERIIDSSKNILLLSGRSVTGMTGLFWLVVLYFFATWLGVGCLASLEFRNQIANEYSGTQPSEVFEYSEDLKYAMTDLNNYDNYMMASVGKWKGEIEKACLELKENCTYLYADVDGSTIADNIDLPNACNGDQSKDTATESCNKLKDSVSSLKSYIAEHKIKKDKINKKITAFENKLKEENSQGKNKTPTSIQGLASGIKVLIGLGYWNMLVVPDQALSLLLAIAMGILGSTITMTWTFLEVSSNPSFRWYILRPFVGSLSALVIFVFAKSGQMALLTNTTNSTLSPFFLSLLAIAAGLLSDRAYARMASISGKVLGDMEPEKKRWPIGLIKALSDQKVTSEELAKHLGMNKSALDSLISGKSPASITEQQRIGDYLRVDPRTLFTDIPPPNATD